jgi:hypothetical protein
MKPGLSKISSRCGDTDETESDLSYGSGPDCHTTMQPRMVGNRTRPVKNSSPVCFAKGIVVFAKAKAVSIVREPHILALSTCCIFVSSDLLGSAIGLQDVYVDVIAFGDCLQFELTSPFGSVLDFLDIRI